MDKIFREIKQAIEEEMARQEGRPTGGSPPQAGRDASRYEDWLQEEQDRLRGSGSSGESSRRQSREDLEDIQISEVPSAPRQGSRRERRERQRQEQRDAREATAAAESAEAAQRARTESMQRGTRHERSEARHRQQTRSGYAQLTGRSDFSTGLWRMLRTRRGLQQAVLLSEIIGKPVSLRKQDDHLIS